MSQVGDEGGRSADAIDGKVRRCSICGQPQEHRFRPFCSRRCADLDLGRWLNESYRVPVSGPAVSEAADREEQD